MNRKLLNGLLVLAVATGGVVTFTSCKDEDFRTNTLLTENSLQAQIDAIRSISDADFIADLERWLNNWTSSIEGSGFKSYEEMVQAASEMYRIYQSIMNDDELSPEAEAYVEKLYNWMFKNQISASDWYDLIYKVAERATSVEVNEVVNPVFGTVKLPLDVKSTVLATYVYEGPTYMFPTAISGHINDASPLSPSQFNADWAELLSGLNPQGALSLVTDFTDNGDLGNMGTAVVTINPSINDYTDLSKYTVELVNSKGEVAFSNSKSAPENVGSLALAQYEDVLYFGGHRADGDAETTVDPSAPGVYAVNVGATVESYKNFMVDLDKSALKDALKKLIDNKSLSDVSNLAKVVWDNMNNKLQAYSVRVGWEENIVDEATGSVVLDPSTIDPDDPDSEAQPMAPVTNYVYSDFNIAATVVHPLSYGTNIGAYIPSDKSVPVIYNPLTEYLEKIRNKINLYTQPIDNVESEQIQIDVTVDGDYVILSYEKKDGTVVSTKLDYSQYGIATSADNLADFVKELLGAENDMLNDTLLVSLNDALDEINQRLNDFNVKANDWLTRIEKDNKLNYAQKLVDIYNELAEKANNFLKDPNHYLQIVMGYYDDGIHHLSNDVKYPITFASANGDLDLITTSYTADLVIPSYKKYVAITGVVNDDYSISTTGLEALNTTAGLNQVVSGTTEKVIMKLKGLEGKTYRVSYISVDYRGECSMENYYVTVK